MTSKLKKTNYVTVLPERAARAAIPYSPAKKAYTATETKVVCQLVTKTTGGNAPSLTKTVTIVGGKAVVSYVQIPGKPGVTTTTRVCAPVTTTVNYPAVPEQKAQPSVTYRPRTVVQEFGLGWNAGARSIAELAGNGSATFTVPSAVGAVVGFNDVGEDAGYLNIEHGLYFRRQSVRAVESGVLKGSETTFVGTDVFKIERVGGRVRYYKNADPIYTSLVPSTNTVFLDASMYSGGDTVEAPALVATTGGYSTASMRSMDGFASETEWSYSRGVMLAVKGVASSLRSRSHAVMHRPAGLAAQGKYGESRATVRPIGGYATAGMFAPAYAMSAAQAMPLYGYAHGPEARYGTSNSIALPMTGMAVEGKYGESRAEMAPTQGYAADRSFLQLPQASMPTPTMGARGGASAALTMPAFVFDAYASPTDQNVAQLTTPAGVLVAGAGAYAAAIAPTTVLNASATTTLLAGAQMVAPAAILDASGTASLTARAELTLSRPYALIGYAGAMVSATIGACTMQASGTSSIAGTAQLTLPLYELDASASLENFVQAELLSPAMAATPWAVAWLVSPAATLTAIGTAVVAVTYEAYAVNLRSDIEGGGNEVTRYTDYPFERIVRWRGNYYGMAADGLYLLEGDTDDGAPISWALRTGTTDFSKPEKKNVASAYVGGRLGPATTFTVFTGEKLDSQYAYTTPRGATAQNYRQKFGRGLDARYYAFQMEGSGELEMDDLTFEVVPRTRRI